MSAVVGEAVAVWLKKGSPLRVAGAPGVVLWFCLLWLLRYAR